MSSVVSRAPQPYTSAYVASKAAVHAFTRCLRMELSLDKRHDIHVCEVFPAAIDTPLFQHAANFTGRAVKALNPVYEPEEVARAIADLIESPQPEVVVGGAGKAMMAHTIAAPRLYEKVAARHIDHDHFSNESAPNQEGNLHASTAPQAVRGGWREHPETVRGGRTSPLTILLGAAAVLGAIVAVRQATGSGKD